MCPICNLLTCARGIILKMFGFSVFVLAAQAKIAGPEEIHVKKGSTISLTCSVNVHSTPPSSVLWYHGRSVVDFDSPRGGISLETEKTDTGTTSKLLVTKASIVDSGNYTCVPSNANAASVWVHVLNGKFSSSYAFIARGCNFGTARLYLTGHNFENISE